METIAAPYLGSSRSFLGGTHDARISSENQCRFMAGTVRNPCWLCRKYDLSRSMGNQKNGAFDAAVATTHVRYVRALASLITTNSTHDVVFYHAVQLIEDFLWRFLTIHGRHDDNAVYKNGQ